MITQKVVWSIGLSQLVLWGISFYFIGVFGDLIVADFGWSRALVYGGFSAALITMGVVSPIVGRTIDRIGGRAVLMVGSMLCSGSLLLLSCSETMWSYYTAWVCLGIAMRCTLYDAAFATLVRIGGASARRSITQITLLGGLAATCFWPLGHVLAETFGWRGATMVYAALSLFLLPLYFAIPNTRDATTDQHENANGNGNRQTKSNTWIAAILYATIVALGNGLHAGMSAHLINILNELGLVSSMAVAVAALRGIGQTTGRILELTFGEHVHPINMNCLAASLIVLSFALGMVAGDLVIAASTFVFIYGAATGLLTITRGTLPLFLFDPRKYGAMVGLLLVPSFLLSAMSPIVFAQAVESYGSYGALGLSLSIGVLMVGASLGIWFQSQRNRRP